MVVCSEENVKINFFIFLISVYENRMTITSRNASNLRGFRTFSNGNFFFIEKTTLVIFSVSPLEGYFWPITYSLFGRFDNNFILDWTNAIFIFFIVFHWPL